MINVFSTLVVCLLTTVKSAGCPSMCTCKWRNGKQTVECVETSLLVIPEGVDPATQVLDLTGNDLRSIQREKFTKSSLINLQKIFLSRCRIKSVQDGALKGLTNLVELDLSANWLETVPTVALLDCPSLMKLSLARNPIKSLDRLAFNHLSFLNNLDLKDCKISIIDSEAFIGLYSLEWLDLSQNNIKSLSGERVFPNTLRGVHLNDNPWNCDCNIAPFNAWLKRELVSLLVQPSCDQPPKYKNILVKTLRSEELSCYPEVSPSNFYLEANETENITLSCQVKSLPAANILWLYNGQILQNNSDVGPRLRLVYYLRENDKQESRLFIYNLNSEQNGTFYCTAENPAGVSYGNYTVMVTLKEIPKHPEDKSDFAIELVAFIAATSLVLLSLCLVLLIMAVIKCHRGCYRKNRPSEAKHCLRSMQADEKTNFKTDHIGNKSKTSGNKREFDTDVGYRSQKQNPDIINEIKGQRTGSLVNEKNSFFVGTYNVLPSNPLLVLADFTSTSRQRPHDSTQPYLNPILTGSFRPISALSFERYVESQDVRYTADGYPQRRLSDARRPYTDHHKSASTTPSHSGPLAPGHASNVRTNGGDPAEKLLQYFDGCRETDNMLMGAMDKDDVQL